MLSSTPPQYCRNTANVTLASEGLVGMRQKVYNLLKGTPFRVVIYHEVSWQHPWNSTSCAGILMTFYYESFLPSFLHYI